MKINICNVGKEIAGMEILKNINVEMTGGKIYGIQGVNGSGKTMLMRAICGLIRVNQGEISINEKVLGKDMSFPESIGVLIENPGLIENYSAFDNLRTLADIKKIATDDEIKELLSKLGLNPDDKKKVKKYSLGMRQKVGIAAAFIENPNIIILDEPFNALDAKTSDVLKKMIKDYINEDRIIVVTCHDFSMLSSICDEIIKMEEGCVVED